MPSNERNSAVAGLGQRGLVSKMYGEVDQLPSARDQMEHLLRVFAEIGSDLDLDVTLNRIVTAAMGLTSAAYGAAALRDPEGNMLSFVHQGMDDGTIRRIGHLPVGRGVLSMTLLDDQPLRMNDLTQHPAAVGFPEHHPPMRAFLAVPITLRGTSFGSLYLTHVDPDRVFSESDEFAVRTLAFTAAVAIDNAQLFERERTAAQWMEASREITTALLSSAGPNQRPLHLIAERARVLAGAEQAIVLVPETPDGPADFAADVLADRIDTLVVEAAAGINAADIVGQRVPAQGSTTGAVFLSGEPLVSEALAHPIEGFSDVGHRPAIVIPLRARDHVAGVIVIARGVDQPLFTESHLHVLSDFAAHAAISLMIASARENSQQLSILAERERIAHDLHDHVIQRIFAAGMDLQGTLARSRTPEITDRLNRTLDDLQTIIEEIRTTIFQLKPAAGKNADFRHRIARVIGDLTGNRDVVTTVRFHGPMAAVGGELAEHAEAVTAEAISNALRHSGGTRLTVEVSVGDVFTLDITDNGCGIPADNARRSGLASMQYRAEQLGGTCEMITPPGGGTRVHWMGPLADY